MPFHGRSPIEKLSTSYTPYFLPLPLWHPGYHKHTPDSVPPQMWQRVRSESDLKEFIPTVRARFERARSDSSINVPELTKGSQRQGRRPTGSRAPESMVANR